MSDFSSGAFVDCLAVSAVAVIVLMLVTWLVGQAIGRFNVIDVSWGLGFVVVAWVAFAASSGDGDATRRAVVVTLVSVWGLRLAGYIAIRSRGKGEDPRYEEMLRRAKGDEGWYALRAIYLPQAIALWFISLPVQVAMFERREPNAVLWIGVAVWAVGLFFESVGDLQLARFRADPSNRGEVMDRGLWRFTRHPNYFGDATVWWGLWIVAAQQWVGVLTVLSPVLMTWTLTRKTGKPLLEKDIAERRPGYADYVRRTSGFFPLPPKRAG